MRFLRHDGIYCSDVSCRLKNLGRSAASGRVRPRFRERAGSKRALPIVAMSSGRLFLSGLLASIARLRFTDDSQLIGVASANGSIYHRTVTCLLTVCLIERGNPTPPRILGETFGIPRINRRSPKESDAELSCPKKPSDKFLSPKLPLLSITYTLKLVNAVFPHATIQTGKAKYRLSNLNTRQRTYTKMATEAQINANRLNALLSTGPKSPEGKAASALNGLRHIGLARSILLKTESPEKFSALLDTYTTSTTPKPPPSALSSTCWPPAGVSSACRISKPPP
jgi:hypothetical protein